MRIVFIAFVFFFISYISVAQGKKISFEYLGVAQGLSQVTVNVISQDNLDRLWIGTRDGLNVYDGVHVKIFRQIYGDTLSLLGSNIKAILIKGDEVWVSTHEGVSCLDTRTLKFRRYPIVGVFSILDYNNELLFGTENGLYRLIPPTGKFKRCDDILSAETPVNKVLRDSDDNLWIGTSSGLFLHKPSSNQTTLIAKCSVKAIFCDKQKRLWVGTADDGVYLFNNKHLPVKHFVNESGESSLSNNIIRDIAADKNGNIWVGTFMGLNIIDPTDFNVTRYLQSDQNNFHLSHNSVYSILKDKQGTMWVGTYFGGLNYYNSEYQIYSHYTIGSREQPGLGYSVVGKMIEDDQNGIWIATEGGGLDFYNRNTGTFKHYVYRKGDVGLPGNNVRSLYWHNKSTLFTGTHLGGFSILDLNRQKFTNFSPNSTIGSQFAPDIVNVIIPSGKKYLLGTHNGVVEFDPVALKFTPFFNDQIQYSIGSVIFSLLEDSKGKLWIGTEKNGLFSYNKSTQELKHYVTSGFDTTAIGSNTIHQIFEDHKFRLWIATLGGGLSQYFPEKDAFQTYNSEKKQLPSNFIYGIQESRYGNLWIASSRGLTRFDVENDRFYNYVHEKGFPISELNEGALLLTRDGEVFIGGINGLISFREADILKKPAPTNLIFTALSVNNQSVVPGDHSGILTQDIAFTNTIKLGPDQTVFSISFASCNYISTYKNRYQYKLDNFDKDWVSVNNESTILYTNLNPGKYKLKVRVLDGVIDDVLAEKSLEIIIIPPFYKTWLAYAVYLLLFIVVVWWLNQIYLSRTRLVDRIKTEQKEKEQIQELNQSKLHFFTNISHEFRTPLTLITGTLEALMEESKIPSKIYRRLLTLQGNAVRLNYLIDELIDFRKLNQGVMKLKVSEIDLIPFLDEIFQAFSEYAQHHHIQYRFEKPSESVMLWCDVHQLEKVFYNLISNAFKVVEESKGAILLTLEDRPSEVEITLSDNGRGIHKDELTKVFDHFYQIEPMSGKVAGKGSGIGLALSKEIIQVHQGKILLDSVEGEGTTFKVLLNKGKDHFNKDVIRVSSNDISDRKIVISEFLVDSDFPLPDQEEPKASEDAPCLLLVEDNVEVRILLRSIFNASYRIIEACDGIEGLALANEKQPDIIISDVMMPNLSGTEMCARLKRNIQTCHIPIILLTARTSMEYKIEGLETGADEYLTKPFSARLLKSRVKNLLQNRINIQHQFSKDLKVEVSEITSNPIDRKLLEKMQAIIEKNIENSDFDINLFAKEIGVGRTQLFAKIKGITGQTPNDFILTYRLKKAADLLINQPEMNISEVAWAVGFSSPRYFSQYFRTHFGVSPSMYGTRSRKSGKQDPETDGE